MRVDNVFFFFQAEDGIRDIGVTGVQTCALPIFEMVVFPKTYQEYQKLLKEDNIILVKGRMSVREDEDVSILAGQIKEIGDETDWDDLGIRGKNYKKEYVKKPVLETSGKRLFIKVDSMKNEELINSIYRIIMSHQGLDKVIIFPEDENTGGKKKTYQLSEIGVFADESLRTDLLNILDETNVIIK